MLSHVTPLNDTSQCVVPASLRSLLFHFGHYFFLAGSLGLRRTYDFMRKQLCCPHMTNDHYATVHHCRLRTQSSTRDKPQPRLKRFFPEGPSEYIGMDVLGPLLKTKKANQFVPVLTDCYTNLSNMIPIDKTNAAMVARIFLEHLVTYYDIPSRSLTDNDFQFVSKIIVAGYSTSGVSNITSAQYYRETISQAERLNFALISRLRRYVPQHQIGWDTYILRVMYIYSIYLHKSIIVPHFSTAITRAPPAPATVVPSRSNSGMDDEMAMPIQGGLELVKYATKL